MIEIILSIFNNNKVNISYITLGIRNADTKNMLNKIKRKSFIIFLIFLTIYFFIIFLSKAILCDIFLRILLEEVLQ